MAERYADDDGYWQVMSSAGPAQPAFPRLPPMTRQQAGDLDRAHYLLRASLIPQVLTETVGGPGGAIGYIEGGVDPGEWRYWSELCLKRALMFAGDSYEFKNLPDPKWVEALASETRNWFVEACPAVADVVVRTTLNSQLHARSRPHNREIEVSLVGREILRSLAIECWNWVFGSLSSKHGWSDDIELRSSGGEAHKPLWIFLRSIVPFYRPVSLSAIPTVRALETIVVHGALTTTRLQLQFMLAHEFAHCALHDGLPASLDLEIEADRYAYSVMYANLPKANHGDLWTAIRWLFTFLSIERSVGIILATGDTPRNDPLGLRLREILPHARIAEIAEHEILLEEIGTLRLEWFRDQILSLAPVDLKALIDSYAVRFPPQLFANRKGF